MIAIAHQTNRTPEAIAKEMGRDMKNTYAVSTRGGVAVIPVTGPLFRHANLLTAICGATSYELLAQDFNKALNDPNISAILFDVDSPGGEVNGCSELADMIYKARGKKPIIAYASGSCCSGAYWIASACDKIMAADTAIRAKDSLAIADGSFKLVSDNDGLHAENGDDDSLGNIYITGEF